MNRRDFIAVMSGVATWPLTANAQKRMPTVGVLWHAGSAQEEDVYLSVMQKAFRDLGYVEGRNIEFLHRFPAETPALFERCSRKDQDPVFLRRNGAGRFSTQEPTFVKLLEGECSTHSRPPQISSPI